MRKNILLILVSLLAVTFCSCKDEKVNSQPLFIIEENGLYGFVDTLGNKVINPQFLAVSPFHDGLAAVVVDTLYRWSKDKTLSDVGLAKKSKKRFYLYIKYGYIDKNGVFVVAPDMVRRNVIEYKDFADGKKMQAYMAKKESAFKYSDGLIGFQDTVSDKFGFIDSLGNIKIEPKYHEIKSFSNGLAAVSSFVKNDPVKQHWYWGFIDKTGKCISGFCYDYLGSVNDNRAIGMRWSQYSEKQKPMNVLDTDENGNIELNEDGSLKTHEIEESPENMYSAITILFDGKGHVIRNDLSSSYVYSDFKKGQGVCVAELNFSSPYLLASKYRFVDTNGNFLKPFYGISEDKGMRLLQSGKYLGYLPEDAIVNDVTYMSDGYAGFAVGEDTLKWYFLDRHLFVCKPINDWDCYEGILPFNYGLAAIKHNGKWGYVNTRFEVVIPLKYDSCEIATPYLCKVYQKHEGTNYVVESWVNRKDSIVWQKILDGKEKIDNLYSNKSKKQYGMWLYKEQKNSYVKFSCLGALVIIIMLFGAVMFAKIKNNQKIKRQHKICLEKTF